MSRVFAAVSDQISQRSWHRLNETEHNLKVIKARYLIVFLNL